MELSPKIAAELADEVYGVQDKIDLKLFLEKSIFSRSSLQNQSFKAEVGTRLINFKDGFGVGARGAGEYEKDLFLMFRGSTKANYGADWFSNGRCGVQVTADGPVHIGFLQIFNSMRGELEGFVSRLIGDAQNPVHTIHCIGHSLGGAIATLTAGWAKRTTDKQVMLYSFGAPKPGFESFAGGLTSLLDQKNIHRMYHATDPVPMVPLYPFTHPPLPGWGHYKASDGAVLSASAHDRKKYIESAEGATWDSMQGPPPMVGFDKIIESWLESDGPVNPSSADTWERINAALQYVLKKKLGSYVIAMQFSFTGAFSLADKIAWILLQGIDLVIGAGKWVLLLMRKMMQVLHMKAAQTVEELTRDLMRKVLERIMAQINSEAKRAIEQITLY